MSRGRAILGLVAGVLQFLYAIAHSGLGGPALTRELAPFNVPADLQASLLVGWHFGGACMLAFGMVLTDIFWKRLRGVPTSTQPAAVIGATYAAFGTWALLSGGFKPFFLIFLVPGVTLLWAARGEATSTRAQTP